MVLRVLRLVLFLFCLNNILCFFSAGKLIAILTNSYLVMHFASAEPFWGQILRHLLSFI